MRPVVGPLASALDCPKVHSTEITRAISAPCAPVTAQPRLQHVLSSTADRKSNRRHRRHAFINRQLCTPVDPCDRPNELSLPDSIRKPGSPGASDSARCQRQRRARCFPWVTCCNAEARRGLNCSSHVCTCQVPLPELALLRSSRFTDRLWSLFALPMVKY